MDNAGNDKSDLKNKKQATQTQVCYRSGIDRQFLMVVILLLCMGTVMIFSASYAFAMENNNDSFFFAKRQVIWAVLGIGIMLFISFFDYRLFKNSFVVAAVMIISTILMILVLVIGVEENTTKGANRWLYFGKFSLQPSEIMKFAVVLFFAKYIPKYSDKIQAKFKMSTFWRNVVVPFIFILAGIIPFLLPILKDDIGNITGLKVVGGLSILIGVWAVFKFNCIKKAESFYYGVFPFIAVLGVVGLLLYLQPHLSGLIIIACIIYFMMILGGTNWQYLVAGAGAGVGGVLLLAKTLAHSSIRLKVWKDPFLYLKDEGWQPAQSLYAIGSGGFWGVGFGNSRQKHLYLPEPQNDYIFSILCEEMGFIGAVFVICVFAYFVYRGVIIALHAPDKFSRLLVMGIISHVALQVLLNIAVVTNTVPSTGISLPFFSYGGTSLVILMAEMGVILSISRYSLTNKK